MTNDELLRDATSVYVIDWPSRDIPDTLARAGIDTLVHGGPRPDHVDRFVVGDDGGITITKFGRPPERADFVFTHRPVDEIDRIIEAATTVGARAIWSTTSSPEAKAAVEAAGLVFIDGPDLADEVRRVRGTGGSSSAAG
jgi:hypothetical protein